MHGFEKEELEVHSSELPAPFRISANWSFKNLYLYVWEHHGHGAALKTADTLSKFDLHFKSRE